jgi:hypothetical protein
VTLSTILYTDDTFPLRSHALAPRVQAKIPKLFAWELFPSPQDVYLWVDASFQLASTAVLWLLAHLDTHELAVFRHPTRRSVAQEARHLKRHAFTPYLQSRYDGEFLDAQLQAYAADPLFADTQLYAGGCLVYRPTPAVQALMTAWWHQITRYHVNDQLSLPYVLAHHPVDLVVLPGHIYQCPHLTCLRGVLPC